MIIFIFTFFIILKCEFFSVLVEDGGPGDMSQYGEDVVEDNDGNFYVCGRKIGDPQGIIAKFNSKGEKQWHRHYYYTKFYSCTIMGEYLYATGAPTQGKVGVPVFKIDLSDGSIDDQHLFTVSGIFTSSGEGRAIITDGSYLYLAGSIDVSNVFNRVDALLVKMDSNLGVMDSITYGDGSGGTVVYEFRGIGLLSDGSIVAVGQYLGICMFHALFDSSFVKQYAYYFVLSYESSGITVKEDNTYFVVGDYDGNGLVVKLDIGGSVEWSKKVYYSGTGSYDEFTSSCTLSYDEDSILLYSYDKNNLLSIITLNQVNGNYESSQRVANGYGEDHYYAGRIRKVSSGRGYITTGRTYMDNPPASMASGLHLARVDDEGGFCDSSQVSPNLNIGSAGNILLSGNVNGVNLLAGGLGAISGTSFTPPVTYHRYCEGCDNYAADDDRVCTNQQGLCSQTHPFKCDCKPLFYGDYCGVVECFGVLTNETDFQEYICSGHGRCLGPNYCSCMTEEYYGERCNVTTCGGILSNDSSVCGGEVGAEWCFPRDSCVCKENYFGRQECNVTSCYGIYSNQTDLVCSGNGVCWPHENCTCEEYHYGDHCNITQCFGVWNNDDEQTVCSGYGRCTKHDRCDCKQDFFGETCNVTRCGEFFSNETKTVCSHHGECVGIENCTCDTVPYPYEGDFCEKWRCFGYDNSNQAEVCSGHGSCVDFDHCECDTNYFGKYCNVTSCDGIMNNGTTTICNGRGVCEYHDECTCDTKVINPVLPYCSCPDYYFGRECKITTCNGVLSNDTSNVCNGIGASSVDCWPHDQCNCLADYYGEDCEVTTCQDVFSNVTEEVCTGHGDCVSHEHCSCSDDPPFFGVSCNITHCYGVLSNESESVCSSHGICWPNDTCSCEANYYGDFCNVTTCSDIFSNVTEIVCTEGRGECKTYDNCTCFEDFYYGRFCQYWNCYDLENEDPRTCSGNGSCVDYNHCECNQGYFGDACSITSCEGIMNNSTEPEDERRICNGRGICSRLDRCECYSSVLSPVPPYCTCPDHYFGEACMITTCDGVFSNSSETVLDNEMCHGHGECDVYSRTCDCENNNYTGDYCEIWDCFDISNEQSNSVCSGHGTCVDIDECECPESGVYSGDECEYWKCFGLSVIDDVNTVCGSHGVCIDQDVCLCNSFYFSSDTSSPCDTWFCGDLSNYENEDPDMCNGHGTCISSQFCECSSGYSNNLCQDYSCGGIIYSNARSCSGNGRCVEPNECECKSGYGGSLCETNYVAIGTTVPLVTVTGFLICLSFSCCLLCCCLCCGCQILLFTIFFGSFYSVQKIKSRKFKKLKNFDLLLKEQELEDDVSTIHLRINKSLFEVDLDEIEIQRKLGEGGSTSIVYKAIWQNKDVAFKCFKTRNVCSTQDNYDSFEREVEVLASVSHPSIVRFYGATLQPPRIGIVMEYCIYGDLSEFLKERRYDKEDNSRKTYPIKEKLRICLEVSQAMEYLHNRKIIHRDLKLENVLLDMNERVKLMDFGLSTIVESMTQQKTTRIGTNLYMAPEVLKENNYTEQCDIFSMGIFIFILMTEIHEPYGEETENVHIEVKVASDPQFRPDVKKFREILRVKERKMEWLEPIMTLCWNHFPFKRPSFKELVRMFQDQMGKVIEDIVDVMVEGGEEEIMGEEEIEFLRKLEEKEGLLKGLREEYMNLIEDTNNINEDNTTQEEETM